MAQAIQRAQGSNGAAGGSSSSATAGATAAQATADISGASKDIPRDARIIGLILASLGVTDAEPGVVAMLLEFAHRYTLEILQEAQIYADHAQRPRDPSAPASGPSPLEVDDLRMAVNSKLEYSYSSPLPKEFLLPLAAQINRVPLPILPESYGIRLPHERDRLTAVNWDLIPVTERRTYPKNDADDQDTDTMAVASTSQAQSGLNGTAAPGASNARGMDLDLAAGDNLFGGNDDDDEDDDDDDDDDEEMEEVVDSNVQPRRSQSKENDDGEGEEDAEDDAEEDDGEEDDDDNGDDDDEDGDENEYQ